MIDFEKRISGCDICLKEKGIICKTIPGNTSCREVTTLNHLSAIWAGTIENCGRLQKAQAANTVRIGRTRFVYATNIS